VFAALCAALMLATARLAHRVRAPSLLFPGTPHHLLLERPG
jgi:hypothetical protein